MATIDGKITDGGYYWSALYPGLKRWAGCYGCSLEVDGFVLILKRDNDTIEFNMSHVVSLAKKDKYDDIKEYVRDRCLNGKSPK